MHQQRIASDEFRRLREARTVFRTQRRELYKADRKLFAELPDWL